MMSWFYLIVLYIGHGDDDDSDEENDIDNYMSAFNPVIRSVAAVVRKPDNVEINEDEMKITRPRIDRKCKRIVKSTSSSKRGFKKSKTSGNSQYIHMYIYIYFIFNHLHARTHAHTASTYNTDTHILSCIV